MLARHKPCLYRTASEGAAPSKTAFRGTGDTVSPNQNNLEMPQRNVLKHELAHTNYAQRNQPNSGVRGGGGVVSLHLTAFHTMTLHCQVSVSSHVSLLTCHSLPRNPPSPLDSLRWASSRLCGSILVYSALMCRTSFLV